MRQLSEEAQIKRHIRKLLKHQEELKELVRLAKLRNKIVGQNNNLISQIDELCEPIRAEPVEHRLENTLLSNKSSNRERSVKILLRPNLPNNTYCHRVSTSETNPLAG